MDLLTHKYGKAFDLRLASFDLLRARVAAATSPADIETVFTEIAALRSIPGDAPTETDLFCLEAAAYLQTGNPTEACISLMQGLAIANDDEIPFFANELDANLNAKNGVRLHAWAADNGMLTPIGTKAETPRQPSLCLLFGKLALYGSQFDTAGDYLSRITNDPIFGPSALIAMGELKLATSDPAAALDSFNAAQNYDVNPQLSLAISLGRITALIKMKEGERALSEISDARKHYSDDNAILQLDVLETQAFIETGAFEKAEEPLKALLAKLNYRQAAGNELYLQVVALHCRTQIAGHRYPEALATLEETLAREPRNGELIWLKAQALIEGQTNTDQAAKLIHYLQNRRLIDFESRLALELELRSTDANAHYFAAYLLVLLNTINDKRIDAWTTRAMELRGAGAVDNLEKGIFLLHGELAERRNDKHGAALEFLEAAKLYYWQSNFQEAEKWFRKVIDLDPSINATYKYCADTLFLRSFQTAPPYNDGLLIDAAISMWNRSPETLVQRKDESWFYTVIARLHDVKFKFNNDPDEPWRSILYQERAVLQDRDDVANWTFLAIFYRGLYVEANSLYCFNKANEIAGNEDFMPDEKMTLLLNIGEYEVPAAYIKNANETSTTGATPYRAWEAYLLFQYEKYDDAANLMDTLINADPLNVFNHLLKTLSYWYNQAFEKARAAATDLLQLREKNTYLREEYSFAWGLFISGNVQSAIAQMEAFGRLAAVDVNVQLSLTIFYLYNGDIENATATFNLFLEGSSNNRTFSEFVRALPPVFAMMETQSQVDADTLQNAKDLGIKWTRAVNEKITTLLSSPLTTAEEFALVKKRGAFADDSPAGIAIRAGLARLAFDSGDWLLAMERYSSLLPYRDLFPEASLALEKLRVAIINESRNLILSGDYDRAVPTLQQYAATHTSEPMVLLLLALAQFAGDKHEDAKASIQSFIHLTPAQGMEWWDDFLAPPYQSALLWNFIRFIHQVYDGASATGFLPSARIWEQLINGKRSPSQYYPITIELAEGLIAPDTDVNNWYVIERLIPEMRSRILSANGVDVPSIYFRINNSLQVNARYRILIDEVPLDSGAVRPNELFVPDASLLANLGISGTEAPNPFLRESGQWVELKYKDELDKAKVSYKEDPFDYIMAHLELLLLQNAVLFINLQYAISYLIAGINAIPEVERTGPVPDLSSGAAIPRIRLFHELLMSLVKENISIANSKIIGGAYIDPSFPRGGRSRALEELRLLLREELPANLEAQTVPAELETAIQRNITSYKDSRYLSMTVQEYETLIEILGRTVSSASPSTKALLVRDGSMRIYLRQLADLDANASVLHVLAKEEASQNQNLSAHVATG